ncbi:unnamed protein product [Urochloa humidicola]
MFQSKRKQTRLAMPRRREFRPAMPRGRWPRSAMPRGRGPPRPRRPPTDRERRLAEEVLHLHSLWRRGPPPVPTPAPEPAPIQSHKTKTSDRKRRKLDGAAPAAAAEPKDTGPELPPAPPPPNSSPKTWPEAAPSSSTPARPPPPTSPGALAQHKALRAAAEFFSNRGDSDDSSDDGEEGSESEGEQDAAGFLTGLFERDAALRDHYERGSEDRQFACLVCAAGTRKARRFRGCLALVQHACDATPRYGRPRAHRAFAAVLCRVLGWDAARLPSIVMDPRGTLGQALAAGATAGVQVAKESGDSWQDTDSSSDEDEEEDVGTGMEDSSTDDDEEENELESSEESSEQEDVETGMEDSSTDGDEEENELESSEEFDEKDDVKKMTEDSKKTDKDEAIDPDINEKSAEKEEIEEIGPTCQKIFKNEVFCSEPVQEVNASKGDSLNQGNDGLVHKQEIAKESSEQEKNVCENKVENGEPTS